MAVQLRRPILVGGIALSFGLWLLPTVHQSVAEWGEVGVLGAIALGTGVWLFNKGSSRLVEFSPPCSPLDRGTVERAIQEAESAIARLETEVENPYISTSLRQQVCQLTAQLERQNLELLITGGKGVGKSRLVQVLESKGLSEQFPTVSLQETTALYAGDRTQDLIPNLDLILFVITSDLTDSEFQLLHHLKSLNQRILLIFNKQDQYLPPERVIVLQQLRQRLVQLLPPEDIVAIAASPTPVKVRQHQSDGSVKEWLEEQPADVTALTQRLNLILTQDAQQLIWGTTLRAAVSLKAEAKTALNQARRDRALPLIEQYQWITAATAFANPVPALDLLATAAISSQLVIELAGIYQQKFSLSQAQSAAKTLSSLMVKLGLVELSTQTIGSILKSNAFTYIAGGAVQGVSAAYLTRLAGLSLIEYFQEQEITQQTATDQPLNFERLKEKLQTVFQQNQRMGFLAGFVQQAVRRLHLNSCSKVSV
ncbi:YcjF family protein [Coleofasciculus sp. G2-EDA-02]|uniref:YcjF family protein n=1 Tax=Coleofasciculus sp. G2-EDA-02 TaxID=3069529 RepID=UPI0032FC5AE5